MSKRRLSEGEELAREAQDRAEDQELGRLLSALQKADDASAARVAKKQAKVDEYVITHCIGRVSHSNVASACARN